MTACKAATCSRSAKAGSFWWSLTRSTRRNGARRRLSIYENTGMCRSSHTRSGTSFCKTNLGARSGIFGAFGRRAAETARVLLERDLAFCVASDGHGAAYRRPILEDVNAWLTEHFGAAYAERMLHENPRRILSGEAGKERIA